jgi:hypothetical protein
MLTPSESEPDIRTIVCGLSRMLRNESIQRQRCGFDGKDATDQIEKRELARRVLRLLDEVVASSPRDTAVRMLHNSAASLLPDRSLFPVENTIEDDIHLNECELCPPGSLDKDTYYRIISELSEVYQRLDRFKEVGYCTGMLNEERV